MRKFYSNRILAFLGYVTVFYIGLNMQIFKSPQNGVLVQRYEDEDNDIGEKIRKEKYVRDIGEDENVRVLIIAYQRTGSSFLGELYNQHPDAFYWFEPVDGMYASMYGTDHGWTVPSDIYSFQNGTKRTIPEFEIDMVTDAMASIFQCDICKLPVEVPFHKFVSLFIKYNKDLLGNLKCFKSIFNTSAPLLPCSKNLHRKCPGRFGKYMDISTKCNQELLSNNTNSISKKKEDFYVHLNKYKQCIAMKKHQGATCIEGLQELCAKRKIRAVKTVRLRMMHAEKLIEKIPDLRVVQVLRDPRAVVRSRIKAPSYSSLYSGQDPVREAKIFCEQMAEDVILRKKLEEKYPNRFMTVLFEDLAVDSKNVGQEMFNFTGTYWHPELDSWLRNNTKADRKQRMRSMTSRNSADVVESWMSQISTKQLIDINTYCQEYFQLVGDIWPFTENVHLETKR